MMSATSLTFFAAGATTSTAIYNMALDTWTSGPPLPVAVSQPSVTLNEDKTLLIMFNGEIEHDFSRELRNPLLTSNANESSL